MLKAALNKKKSTGVCRVDGWRLSELKALPLYVLNDFAALFNNIERTGVWPAALLTALVSMIPKDESGEPLKHRPITVTSAVYRLWASVRLQDLVVWQNRWVRRTQKAFRQGYGTEDALIELSMQLEEAMLSDTPLHGIALDFAKCFDRIPQELTFRLMEDLGMHPDILRPVRTMYANLKRRFNFAVGVGREFGVTNGILQGCPISVLLINGLMSILFSCVEEETGADSVSYADDAYLLAMLEETLQEATDKVIEFNTYTGGLMNNEKTKTFSTVEDARHQIRGEGGAPLEMMDIVKTLGVQLRARGPDTQLKKQLL